MYFLALRAATLGTQAVLRRRSNLARSVNRFKKERAGLIASLRSTPMTQSGAFPPHVPSSYSQLLRLTAVLRSSLVLQAVTKVYVDDDSNRRGLLMFYRLQAVLMTRAVDPREEGGGGAGRASALILRLRLHAAGTCHYVGGAVDDSEHILGGPAASGWGPGLIDAKSLLPSPSPELPLPLPAPVICGLPEYLVKDVADYFSWLGHSHAVKVRGRAALLPAGRACGDDATLASPGAPRRPRARRPRRLHLPPHLPRLAALCLLAVPARAARPDRRALHAAAWDDAVARGGAQRGLLILAPAAHAASVLPGARASGWL